ncbi:MAG: LCCL domain-containing protein [Candidatus Fermentibacteraceae bacterium]
MTFRSFRSGSFFIACLVLSAVSYAQSTEMVLDDPGNLVDFRGQEGMTYYFRVTGSTQGSLWGTGVYTDDSSLATVAVHAGVLQEGQVGVVKVTILAGQSSYDGTTRNGVTSRSYGNWHGSYMVEGVSKTDQTSITVSAFPDPGNLTDYRGQDSAPMLFVVTGSTQGSVWGTDVYTDDSSLATAAVHSGILANGESGIVVVTILPGRSDYNGSTRNGVTSYSYGNWYGSYSVGEP